jgi:hypothetical protein
VADRHLGQGRDVAGRLYVVGPGGGCIDDRYRGENPTVVVEAKLALIGRSPFDLAPTAGVGVPQMAA